MSAGVDEAPLDRFLPDADAARVRRTLEALNACGLRNWTATGGLAVEAALARSGAGGQARPLHDIDIVVAGFDALPLALGKRFLIRHVHPQAPAGKLVIQLVDPVEALRIDVFSARGGVMDRSRQTRLGPLAVRVLATEDIVAKLCSLTVWFDRDATAPAKHARDYARLIGAADPDLAAAVWEELRDPRDPADFADARRRADAISAARRDCVDPSSYSRDPPPTCPRCDAASLFRLADLRAICDVLGYC